MKKILDRTKKVELRKRGPKCLVNDDFVFLWSTYPTSAFVGAFKVEEVLITSPNILWNLTYRYAGVTRKEFDTYFGNALIGMGICFFYVFQFEKPINLDTFRKTSPLFKPPQSFRYAEAIESQYFKSIIL